MSPIKVLQCLYLPVRSPKTYMQKIDKKHEEPGLNCTELSLWGTTWPLCYYLSATLVNTVYSFQLSCILPAWREVFVVLDIIATLLQYPIHIRCIISYWEYIFLEGSKDNSP